MGPTLVTQNLGMKMEVLEIFSKLGLTPYRTHAENGDNSKSKGVPTNLKVPTDLSWKKLSFGAS